MLSSMVCFFCEVKIYLSPYKFRTEELELSLLCYRDTIDILNRLELTVQLHKYSFVEDKPLFATRF